MPDFDEVFTEAFKSCFEPRISPSEFGNTNLSTLGYVGVITPSLSREVKTVMWERDSRRRYE